MMICRFLWVVLMIPCVSTMASLPGFYVSDVDGALLRLDVASGAVVNIGDMGVTMRDIAFSPEGMLFGVGEDESLYTIDTSDGAIAEVGPLGVVLASGLDFDSTGTLYLATSETGTMGSLHTVDTLTGETSLVGSSEFVSDGDLAFAPDGTLYMLEDSSRLVTLDPLTGDGEVVGPHSFANINGGDFFGASLFGVTLEGELVQFDLASGQAATQFVTDPVVVAAGVSFLAPDLTGDYNGDGFVSQGDLDLVLLNWGGHEIPAGWVAPDQFNGLMSQDELDGVLLNWGDGIPPVLTIPEPGSLAVAGFLGLAGLICRRR